MNDISLRENVKSAPLEVLCH